MEGGEVIYYQRIILNVITPADECNIAGLDYKIDECSSIDTVSLIENPRKSIQKSSTNDSRSRTTWISAA